MTYKQITELLMARHNIGVNSAPNTEYGQILNDTAVQVVNSLMSIHESSSAKAEAVELVAQLVTEIAIVPDDDRDRYIKSEIEAGYK